MRYRALDANGDMTFGRGSGNFLADSPATVAQAMLTALRLHAGEWFLDTSAGLDLTKVVGNVGKATADAEIQRVILGTLGVTDIVAGSYSSSVTNRALSVSATIDTLYGQTPIAVVLP